MIRLATTLMLILLGAAWIAAWDRCAARAEEAPEYQVKAAFLYNFAKFVEWPAGAFGPDSSPFITKPIDRIELKVRLTSLLKMKEAQDAIKRSQEELRARNALMQADLELAQAMQQAFILKEYPSFPPHVAPNESALCFCHRYIPAATLGGDFFDVLALSDTAAGVFICDVMGHGVRSALVTAMMRVLVDERDSIAADPGKFLSAINHHLLAILEQAHTPMFISAFYLIADIASGRMCYANAGHPSPLRVRRSANTVEWLLSAYSPSGPALGIFKDASYEPAWCDLAADDLFVLFTDGLVEVTDASEEYGQERLLSSVRRRMNLPTLHCLTSCCRKFSNFQPAVSSRTMCVWWGWKWLTCVADLHRGDKEITWLHG
jgi:serine phosphatase RsbU (regulator of sigma subunit)